MHNYNHSVGGQDALPAPQLLGSKNGRKSSEKGGIIFGRSDSFGKDDRAGRNNIFHNYFQYNIHAKCAICPHMYMKSLFGRMLQLKRWNTHGMVFWFMQHSDNRPV